MKATAVVRRVLPAPPEVVFGEWLDPEALADFICPAPVRPGAITCDPRVGGAFSIEMIGPNRVTRISGEYLALDLPRLLRFTWLSELAGGFDSVVTVTLQPHGDGETLMTIEHVGLPPELHADYQGGWERIADQLAEQQAAG